MGRVKNMKNMVFAWLEKQRDSKNHVNNCSAERFTAVQLLSLFQRQKEEDIQISIKGFTIVLNKIVQEDSFFKIEAKRGTRLDRQSCTKYYFEADHINFKMKRTLRILLLLLRIMVPIIGGAELLPVFPQSRNQKHQKRTNSLMCIRGRNSQERFRMKNQETPT